MLTVTPSAQEKIHEILVQKKVENYGVRIRILGKGIDSFAYDFSLMPPDFRLPDDLVVETDQFSVFVDQESAELMNDATVDFDVEQNGFMVDNPAPVWDNKVGPKVARVIIEEINPGVASHGGAIMLVDVKDNVAYVRMLGGCQGCGMASVTLSDSVERMVKQAVPEIASVVDITRHGAGTNPYYANKS